MTAPHPPADAHVMVPIQAAASVPAASAPASAAPAESSSPGLPSEFADQIGRINALAAAGRLDEAFSEATALRESLTSAAGAEDPHALEARAMEAYLAHLRGDHREAVVLALAVARIRCRTRDGRAPADVERAAASWQKLDDDRAAVVHGRELLHMWDRLHSRGQLTPGHLDLAEQVRLHVDALEAYV